MYKLAIRVCNFIFGKHKNNTLPRYWILAVDMLIVVVAYLISLFLLYFRNFHEALFDWDRIWIIPICYLIAFLISRTYDGMLRYSGFNDIRKIMYACTTTLAVLIISKFFISLKWPNLSTNYYPRYVTIIYHYLITIVLMVIMRFTIRRLYNEVYKNAGEK